MDRPPRTRATAVGLSAGRDLLRHLNLSDPRQLQDALPTKSAELSVCSPRPRARRRPVRKPRRKPETPMRHLNCSRCTPRSRWRVRWSWSSKRCGRSPCRCESGQLHGPYHRLRWHEGGRLRSRYVPAAHVSWVSEAVFLRRMFRRCRRPAGVRWVLAELRRLGRGVRVCDVDGAGPGTYRRRGGPGGAGASTRRRGRVGPSDRGGPPGA